MSNMLTSVPKIKIKLPNREQKCIQMIRSGKWTIFENNEYDTTNEGHLRSIVIGLHSPPVSSVKFVLRKWSQSG